jgi:hypothetical protein
MLLTKVNPATGDRGARQKKLSWWDGAEHIPSQFLRQAVIRAELTGSDTCTAHGIIVRSSIPVLAMCRRLTEAGCDSATPLEAHRGEILCLRVGSIGQGARLEINARGNGFIARRAVRAGPPMRQNQRVAS